MSKVYGFNEFFNGNLTTPNKHNELYLQMLEELHDKYPELDLMGIYAMKYNGKIIYVGKSTQLAKRWIGHIFNMTHEESKEHFRGMYITLRHLARAGELEFEVLETVEDKDKLDWLEGYYINKHLPCLNRIVPKLWQDKKAIYLNEIPLSNRLALEELGKDIREHCCRIA